MKMKIPLWIVIVSKKFSVLSHVGDTFNDFPSLVVFFSMDNAYHQTRAHEIWFANSIISITIFTEADEYRVNRHLN